MLQQGFSTHTRQLYGISASARSQNAANAQRHCAGAAESFPEPCQISSCRFLLCEPGPTLCIELKLIRSCSYCYGLHAPNMCMGHWCSAPTPILDSVQHKRFAGHKRSAKTKSWQANRVYLGPGFSSEGKKADWKA